MKIAQITTIFPPYRGGIGQVAFNYSERLRTRGLEVEVVTVDFGKKESFAYPVHYLKPWLSWGRAGFCPQLYTRLKKYNVIHLHYPSFGLAEVVWLWRIFNRKSKLVIFYHHDVVGAGLLGLIFSWHKRLLLPCILKSADKIMVSSFDYARHSDIRRIYDSNMDKFLELPFGVSDNFSNEKNKEILKEFNIDTNKKIVLFVGGLDRNHYFKGVDKLIQAVAGLSFNMEVTPPQPPPYQGREESGKFPYQEDYPPSTPSLSREGSKGGVKEDWQLVLVGGGELIFDLEDLAKKLKIQDRVTFAGWQSDERLVKFYQAADLFVLPSTDRSEAFGIVLIEAMACGLPVIASDLPGVRSVVRNNVTGLLVPPGEVDSLSHAIEKILTDDNIRNSFSRNAVQYVNNNYRWDGIIEKLVDIYNN